MANLLQPLLNVFMYHRVLEKPTPDGVSAVMFSRQLDYLQAHYTILNSDQLIEFLQGMYTPPRPAAAITFDDGWLDNWLVATPILQRREIPAILALSTALVYDGPLRSRATTPDFPSSADGFCRALYGQDRTAFLSWAEIQAMQTTGLWSIQAHGHTHAACYYRWNTHAGHYPDKKHWSVRHALGGAEPFGGVVVGELASELACRQRQVNPQLLAELQKGAGNYAAVWARYPKPLEYIETIEQAQSRWTQDLQECSHQIEIHTGIRPQLFFWPWGHYSPESLAVAATCGFRYTFSVEKGYITLPLHHQVLPRIGVSEKWRKFQRNSTIYRSRILAGIHRLISPSPSGVRRA